MADAPFGFHVWPGRLREAQAEASARERRSPGASPPHPRTGTRTAALGLWFCARHAAAYQQGGERRSRVGLDNGERRSLAPEPGRHQQERLL